MRLVEAAREGLMQKVGVVLVRSAAATISVDGPIVEEGLDLSIDPLAVRVEALHVIPECHFLLLMFAGLEIFGGGLGRIDTGERLAVKVSDRVLRARHALP